MAKIRSVEFSALKLTADMLVKAIDEGELDRNAENLTQGFIKKKHNKLNWNKELYFKNKIYSIAIRYLLMKI